MPLDPTSLGEFLIDRPRIALGPGPASLGHVLVTGAAGSVGALIARALVEHEGVDSLTLLDRAETRLVRLLDELGAPERVSAELVDVLDADELEHLSERVRPDVIIHAAAYKHVPLLQTRVRAALRNNLLGCAEVASVARRCGARLVLLSTDKAVAPTSVMGASKWLCERYLATWSRGSAPAPITLRFGNVLGSRGSVLEVFERQLAAGEPMTLTHREMTRIFLLREEVVDFVLHALDVCVDGGTFVLDPGSVTSIEALAARLARVRGVDEPRIVDVGMRPGERLDERLHDDHESLEATSHSHVWRVVSHDVSHDGAPVRALEALARGSSEGELASLLAELVPSSRPSS